MQSEFVIIAYSRLTSFRSRLDAWIDLADNCDTDKGKQYRILGNVATELHYNKPEHRDGHPVEQPGIALGAQKRKNQKNGSDYYQ